MDKDERWREVIAAVIQSGNNCHPIVMPHHVQDFYQQFRDANASGTGAVRAALVLAGACLRYAWENWSAKDL